jgi:folate-binding Fe-S cluster repair protein YgfZ
MSQKAELVITALQQRIGELVSNYETQIAILRADITALIQEREEQVKQDNEKKEAIEAYSEHLDDIATN